MRAGFFCSLIGTIDFRFLGTPILAVSKTTPVLQQHRPRQGASAAATARDLTQTPGIQQAT